MRSFRKKFLKRTKKPFLLLEVLLSISLVSLALLPILSWQATYYSVEKNLERSEQAIDYAPKVYARLVEDLYLGKIALSSIPQKREKRALNLTLDDLYLQSIGYRGEFNLTRREGKQGDMHLIQTQLLLMPLKGDAKPFAFTFNLTATSKG